MSVYLFTDVLKEAWNPVNPLLYCKHLWQIQHEQDIKASVSALFISYEFTGHQAAFLHTTQEKEKASLFDSSHASHR